MCGRASHYANSVVDYVCVRALLARDYESLMETNIELVVNDARVLHILRLLLAYGMYVWVNTLLMLVFHIHNTTICVLC